MKKSIFLILTTLFLFVSCKKDGTKYSRFSIQFAQKADSVYYDSVAYAVINYSDLSEIKDTTDRKNPDIFSHSIKVNKQTGLGLSYTYGLTLAAEHWYILKKFDLVSKLGNVIYYIPYGVQYYWVDNIRYEGLALPFSFKAFDGQMLTMVTKK